MTFQKKKGAGFVMPSQPHYTDHLGVICMIMKAPLIFVEEPEYLLAKKYYPNLHALRVDYDEFSPEYLIAHYDVIFNTDNWDRDELNEVYYPLEKKYGKRIRNVHCPHGFSDKGFYLRKCAKEDICLIYGQNMIDQLKNEGVFEQLQSYVNTGNYRYSYYKQNREFYDNIVKEEVLSRFDQSRPLILYAPTWKDYEESTTFFTAHEHILGNLPSTYNMIVKLHPRLEDEIGEYYKILGKYEHKPNILFLEHFPPVYPLLAHADLYIGDMSSIGYDFLPFNKPMFFLNKQNRNPKTDRGLYLFRCGTEIRPEDYPKLYPIIEKALSHDAETFSDIRAQVYNYTFGHERPFADIKQDIEIAYSSERP